MYKRQRTDYCFEDWQQYLRKLNAHIEGYMNKPAVKTRLLEAYKDRQSVCNELNKLHTDSECILNEMNRQLESYAYYFPFNGGYLRDRGSCNSPRYMLIINNPPPKNYWYASSTVADMIDESDFDIDERKSITARTGMPFEEWIELQQKRSHTLCHVDEIRNMCAALGNCAVSEVGELFYICYYIPFDYQRKQPMIENEVKKMDQLWAGWLRKKIRLIQPKTVIAVSHRALKSLCSFVLSKDKFVIELQRLFDPSTSLQQQTMLKNPLVSFPFVRSSFSYPSPFSGQTLSQEFNLCFVPSPFDVTTVNNAVNAPLYKQLCESLKRYQQSLHIDDAVQFIMQTKQEVDKKKEEDVVAEPEHKKLGVSASTKKKKKDAIVITDFFKKKPNNVNQTQ